MNRVRQWEGIRRQLVTQFSKAGITRCEFGYNDCCRDWGLSFAHKRKRRFLKDEQLWEVALACAECHTKLEVMSHAAMEKEVARVIAAR